MLDCFLRTFPTFLNRFLYTLDSNLNTKREYQKVTTLITTMERWRKSFIFEPIGEDEANSRPPATGHSGLPDF